MKKPNFSLRLGREWNERMKGEGLFWWGFLSAEGFGTGNAAGLGEKARREQREHPHQKPLGGDASPPRHEPRFNVSHF